MWKHKESAFFAFCHGYMQLPEEAKLSKLHFA
jgi:hypothetical protein